jgi:hypothetical protein
MLPAPRDCSWQDRSAAGTMRGKESAMIELKEDQLQALDAQGQPAVVVDPRTGEEFVLIRREMYEKVQKILAPFNRGWDDPGLDVYEQYRKKK